MQKQLSLAIGQHRLSAQELIRSAHTLIRLDVGTLAEDIVTPLKRLISEPRDYREEWEFAIKRRLNGRPDPDDGLIRRAGEPGDEPGENFDRKFVFMYRPRLDQLLTWRGVDRKGYQPLLDACEKLTKTCRSTLFPIVQELDELIPGSGFEMRYIKAITLNMDALRVLVYDQGQQQGLIGKGHTDRDFITIQVAESRPGMRTGPERTLYRGQPGTALAFTGKKFPAHTGGKVPALEHDVIETEADGDSRWSLIYFGHIVLPPEVKIPHGE